MKHIVVCLVMLAMLVACQEKKSQASQGTFFINNTQGEPSSLDPLSSNDGAGTIVQAYVLETLLERDIETYQWKPALAKSWEVSKDKKSYTFVLRDGVKWHDGKPLTVEDVKFSFDAIFDENFKTAHLRPYYENIEKVEIVDAQTIKFYLKDDYFKNFDVAAGLTVLPKHFYGDQANKKEFSKKLIGTGPYKFTQYEKGKRIVFDRNEEWWGRQVEGNKQTWNYPRLVMRFLTEENVILETFKKGDLDYVSLRPEAFMKRTDGPEWGTKLFKVKTSNKAPKGYTFVGWNLRHPILSDKKVRVALAKLYNRDFAMDKFEFNLSAHADGPIEPSSDFHPSTLKPVGFDPEGALKLLTDAGWKDTDGDGLLDKVIKGKKTQFSVSILEPLPDYVKYLTIYKEEAKKVGIEINIQQIEWNSFLKLIDERKFDAVRLAWGPGTGDPDPKQIWHSSSMDGNGSNFIGYSVPEVDRMIDQARKEHDREKRIKLLNKVYETIANDSPYLFIFAGKTTLYAHNGRIQKTRDTFTYGVGTQYWTLVP